MALAGPEAFPPAEGPPAGLHRLVFGDSRPLDQHELRRLAPAAVFEAAHLVADLTHVDGAVVMTTGLDLLGFGEEIAGDVPEVPRVMRARDLEGVEREWVRTDRVGTRHRSAYRLCHILRDAPAVVVSQDGGRRFIRWHKDAVTYWEQVATAPWEVYIPVRGCRAGVHRPLCSSGQRMWSASPTMGYGH